MDLRTRALILTPFLFMTMSPASSSTIEKIRNPQVVVMEEILAPGEAEVAPVSLPSLVVYMAGQSAQLESTHGTTQRTAVTEGDVLFQPSNAGAIKNTGTIPLHFARIEYLTDGSSETWGMTGLSPNYKMLLENQYGRAYDIKIAAGTKEPQHTHHDRVVISLSGAKLEHILPSGQIQPSTLKTGEIVWRLGGTHVGHNMGTTDLWVIAVEPK
jgi:hypothetical protein